MAIHWALTVALSLTPATPERLVAPALAGPLEAAAARCVAATAPPRGTHAFAWGVGDAAVKTLPLGVKAACLAAVSKPEARPGALRLVPSTAPFDVLSLTTVRLMGWCRTSTQCARLQCATAPSPAAERTCLTRVRPTTAEGRNQAAVALLRAKPDDFDAIASARETFQALSDGGYYPALTNLALAEYRLTNLEAAYEAAVKGAGYRLPTAMVLAAYLKLEGFGPRWDLTGAFDLLQQALAAGNAEAKTVLAMDISYLFSPAHWRRLQEALAAAGHYEGRIDGHFRGPSFEALTAFAKANGVPDGVTVHTLHALGVLAEVNDTIRPQRYLFRY